MILSSTSTSTGLRPEYEYDQSQNVRDQRVAGVHSDLTKNRTTATPLHPMGTPVMGVIVMGCKSPVRDWNFQMSVYQMMDLERQVLDEGNCGRVTVRWKEACECVG